MPRSPVAGQYTGPRRPGWLRPPEPGLPSASRSPSVAEPPAGQARVSNLFCAAQPRL